MSAHQSFHSREDIVPPEQSVGWSPGPGGHWFLNMLRPPDGPFLTTFYDPPKGVLGALFDQMTWVPVAPQHFGPGFLAWLAHS